MEIKLTFLAARELRSFSTDLCLEAVRQTANELEDVGIGAGFFNFLLRNFFNRLGSAEKNVELDGSIIQSWFLGYQSQMFPIFPNVQFRDLRIVQLEHS